MSSIPSLSVIIPTHNPDAGRLQRTLAALALQSLPISQWETILVDNASKIPVQTDMIVNCRIIRESKLGLTAARRRGLHEACGDFVVFVDDDNVLAPDYLATVLILFSLHPQVGVLGGKSLPEFKVAPPNWIEEFFGLLALRDLGNTPLLSTGLRPAGATRNEYPPFAPIGAGMALRRAAWSAWLNTDAVNALSDRRGTELTSGGDNDIVLCAMRAGWEVGYFPNLSLIHLIPAGRVAPHYLARLNRGIQKSWMQVLARHDANPWPPLSRPGAFLRQAKAWFTCRAWSGPAAYIRWQGACGHFEGRAFPGPSTTP